MPTSRRAEWEYLLKIEDVRDRRIKLEEYLDRGLGGCRLHDPKIAQIMEDALQYSHQQRYELLAWCIMPNHVHVLYDVWATPLWKVVQGWKIHTTTRLRRQRRSGDSRSASFGNASTGTPSCGTKSSKRKRLNISRLIPPKRNFVGHPKIGHSQALDFEIGSTG
jgi:REP element-mobilizing transposase RayT